MIGESSKINQSKSQKPRKNLVPQIQKKEKTSYQEVVKYLLHTVFDLTEYHGMPFPPPPPPQRPEAPECPRRGTARPMDELSPKLPLT